MMRVFTPKKSGNYRGEEAMNFLKGSLDFSDEEEPDKTKQVEPPVPISGDQYSSENKKTQSLSGSTNNQSVPGAPYQGPAPSPSSADGDNLESSISASSGGFRRVGGRWMDGTGTYMPTGWTPADMTGEQKPRTAAELMGGSVNDDAIASLTPTERAVLDAFAVAGNKDNRMYNALFAIQAKIRAYNQSLLGLPTNGTIT